MPAKESESLNAGEGGKGRDESIPAREDPSGDERTNGAAGGSCSDMPSGSSEGTAPSCMDSGRVMCEVSGRALQEKVIAAR